MKKSVILSAFLLLAGCGPAVKHTVAPEYVQIAPKRVVILPVIWDDGATAEADKISLLFRQMSSEKLGLLNYSAVPLSEVDSFSGGRPGWFSGKTVDEIAAPFKADSVLFIRVTDWDKDDLLPYTSLKIGASFELASALGKTLWKAQYSTSEADLGLDTRTMELAVHSAFEPRIQRFVDAVFSTMPAGEVQKEQRKSYFDWLP